MELSYEENINKLEKIVAELEKGNLSLDDSLRLYEEGAIISENCRKLLSDAKLKITNLNEVAENG